MPDPGSPPSTDVRDDSVARFFEACSTDDVPTLRLLIRKEPGLIHRQGPNGMTGLHLAVRHPDAVEFLLERGADPNVRDTDDNALPIHVAAGHGHIDSVRALLDAGSDVQGEGDLHEMDTIGWATCFADPRRDIVKLLLSRGARHHVFSAIATGDRDALRRMAAEDPAALHRRLSKYEQHQTPVHYAVAPADGLVGGTFRTGDHYKTLALLIELGAEVDAPDAVGRTPLERAMLRGDREAMRLLLAAGAAPPEVVPSSGGTIRLDGLLQHQSPMIAVPDVNATVAWFQAIGFDMAGSNENDGVMDWASVACDGHEVMFVSSGERRGREAVKGLSLWFRTDRLDDLYARFRQRALAQSRAFLAGEQVDGPGIRLSGELYTAFYGQREFSLRDPNGIEVCFYQPLE